MKNTMDINYYRYPNSQGEDESWQNCQFTHETDLTHFAQIRPLVSLNGQPVIRQHHSTYLTGKDTCRAHHFAKLLAIKVLKGEPAPTILVPCAVAPAKAPVSNASACKVLWIDTLHGPHICTRIYNELAAHATAKQDLHFVCLDILGSQRENVYAINRNIESLIHHFKPELVVIDDIDHFMPFCGVHVATEFCRIVRDVTNHTETAFLFIGYNHLGKKASTTGNLGKYLFIDASDVFSLSTQREVTTVRLVRSYDLSLFPDDSEYRFIIGDDNLPHEAQRAPKFQAIDEVPEPDPEACDSSTIHDGNNQETTNIDQTINNSLTLPTPLSHNTPSHNAHCHPAPQSSIARCQRAPQLLPAPHQPLKAL